jgi:hypothetical protein
MKRRIIDKSSLPLQSRIRVAGVTCLVASNSYEIITSLSGLQNSNESAGHSFELDVLVDSTARRDANAHMYFRGLHHLVFAVFSRGESFVFDLLRRRITGVVSMETARDEKFWTTRMIPLALGLLGGAIGIAPLHCACLDWNGNGLLLAGDSGAGKSTLTVALAQRGFSLISDGWTYIARNQDKELVAHGISAPVKLLPDAISHFPELRGFDPERSFNGEMAFEVDATAAFGAKLDTESRPRWLLFLERTVEALCEIIPYSGEAARAFFASTIELLPPQLRFADDTRVDLIAALTNTSVWRFRYGGPPIVAAEKICKFCERDARAAAGSCAIS